MEALIQAPVTTDAAMPQVGELSKEQREERLREIINRKRKQRGLSMRQASIQAGLDDTAISRYLRGTKPSPLACEKLGTFFGVNPEELKYLAGHRGDPPGSGEDITPTPVIDEDVGDELRALVDLITAIPDEDIRKTALEQFKEQARTLLRAFRK